MPPKAAQIEEFDDDTDFALPTVPAPSSGFGGPSMPSIPGMPNLSPEQMAEFQRLMSGMGGAGGPAGGMPGLPGMGAPPGKPTSSIPPEAKKWITLYPIYFDAKRCFGKGCRRVKYEISSPWPLSVAVQAAAKELGLQAFHEPYKVHPQDWENPGRVKVQLYDDEGKALNGSIATKTALQIAVAKKIQSSCGGTPPPLPPAPTKQSKAAATQGDAKAKDTKDVSPATSSKKGVTPAKGAAASTSAIEAPAKVSRSRPKRPNPLRERVKHIKPAPMHLRYPMHSPAVEHGLLNADLGSMMGLGGAGGGGAGGADAMGPLGAMMGNLGLGMGDDDEEDEEERKRKEEEAAAEAKKRDPFAGMGRRGRKKVVRIGR